MIEINLEIKYLLKLFKDFGIKKKLYSSKTFQITKVSNNFNKIEIEYLF